MSSENFSQKRWNCVADLPSGYSIWAIKSKIARKGLQAGCLSHADRSVLNGMSEPTVGVAYAPCRQAARRLVECKPPVRIGMPCHIVSLHSFVAIQEKIIAPIFPSSTLRCSLDPLQVQRGQFCSEVERIFRIRFSSLQFG